MNTIKTDLDMSLATAKYFWLRKGTHQGDPISAFFILALEMLFYLIKSKSEIKGLAIFDCCYLYFPYAGDAVSLRHMVDTFFFRTFLD